MMALFSTLMLFVAFHTLETYATEAKIDCMPEQAQTNYAVKTSFGNLVRVETHAYISGHVWSSQDGIVGMIKRPAPMGGLNTVEFIIDTTEQRERKKTYHFILKRPWEEEVVAKCDVMVKLK
jgi:hypothetical protein